MSQALALSAYLSLCACGSTTVKGITYLPDVDKLSKGVNIWEVLNRLSIAHIAIKDNTATPARVVIAFDLDLSGHASNISAQLSHPVKYFDDAAVEFVRQYVNEPYSLDNEPVKVKNVRSLLIYNGLRDAPTR